MRYHQLLSITLCLYIGIASAATIEDCGNKNYWIVSRQTVYTKSSLAAGRTEVSVYLNEVFSSGSRDMVRTIKLKQAMAVIRLFAWQKVFSDDKKYKVVEKSPYTVYKVDGIFLSYGEKTLKGELTLGENTIENDGLMYKFFAEKGGQCNPPKPEIEISQR